MTQEELDALMSGDIEDLESLADDDISDDFSVDEDDEFEDDEKNSDESLSSSKQTDEKPLGYTPETAHHWPLPATNENKMVHQLDDVTKESEEKASEIFDLIESVSNELIEKEESLNNLIEVLKSNVELFTTLNKKFPDVIAFEEQMHKNTQALDEADETLQTLQTSGESIMSVMDIMQYQDVHRQKIERVINVMRALSNYMNSLFEGKVDDEKRVSSATHIVGDTHNEIASNEDIEALLAQFGS